MHSVCLAMVLLVLGGSLASTDVLLNGVAIAFVLVIDDELTSVVISQTESVALDAFADGIGSYSRRSYSGPSHPLALRSSRC